MALVWAEKNRGLDYGRGNGEEGVGGRGITMDLGTPVRKMLANYRWLPGGHRNGKIYVWSAIIALLEDWDWLEKLEKVDFVPSDGSMTLLYLGSSRLGLYVYGPRQ